MAKISILIFILLLIPLSLAHTDETTEHTVENGHSEEELSQLDEAKELAANYQTSPGSPISPWTYIKQGNWIGAIISLLIWALVIKALYEIIILIFGRHLH